MTALSHSSTTTTAAFALAIIDMRRAIDAAPENERAVLFAAGAREQVSVWSGVISKITLVDHLHEIGVAVGLGIVVIQDAMADAFRIETGGAR